MRPFAAISTATANKMRPSFVRQPACIMSCQVPTDKYLYQQWGLGSDRRVPADYDDDGRTDFAIVRPPNNDWYILNCGTGSASYRQWGANSDALIPGDYNGDGVTEVSTYRAAEGNWYIPQCADYKQSVTKFGASGDVAVPSSFIP